MRLLYLSISYVPSRSASSVHAMKMCAALARQGHHVELVTKDTPSRFEAGIDNDSAFYGVDGDFTITKLARPARRGGGLVFLRAVHRLLAEATDLDLVYSRDLPAAWLAARQGHPVVFEAHGLPQGAIARFALRRLLAARELKRLVFISEALRSLWQAEGLVPPGVDTLVAHDAADPMPELDSPILGSQALRVGYVGHLYGGRGVEIILEAARRLPEIEFHLVGGRERELAAWRAEPVPDNIAFHGFVPPAELPALYRTFDVLLMPYQRSVAVRSGHSDTARWMSPMKMFEYMATGKAIVSSDLPVLREVLEDGVNALLVAPEDAAAWTQAIETLAHDDDLRRGLGQRAQSDFFEHYTWSARAVAVLADLER